MSLYTGTTVTPDESWQCSQTIGGVGDCKGCIQRARICPFSRPAASSHLCNGCFYWWNRVTWEQLVIYNAYIACLGGSEAEDVGKLYGVRAQCLTPIFTEPCSDRLLSTACWAASLLHFSSNKGFLCVYMYVYVHIILEYSLRHLYIYMYIYSSFDLQSTHFQKTFKNIDHKENYKQI